MNRADDVVETGFLEPVEVEVDRRLWSLEVRTEAVEEAAAVWRECARRAAVKSADVPAAKDTTLRDDVSPRLRRMAGLAQQIAAELELAASQSRQGQERLDEMFTDLMAAVPAGDRRPSVRHPGPAVVSRSTHADTYPSHVVFRVSSFQHLRLIEEAKANAKRVRRCATETMEGVRASLETVTRQLRQLGDGITAR